MGNYYLAVDIGASSGRHMLASMEDGKMKLEEVYRFPNGMDNKNGTLWVTSKPSATNCPNAFFPRDANALAREKALDFNCIKVLLVACMSAIRLEGR